VHRSITVLILSAIALMSAAAPAGAGHPQGRCGRGFELMTVDDTLPLVSEGSPNPVDVLLAALQAIDKNDDDLVCVKDLPDTPGSPSYVRNVVDNTAQTPA
jgi:hypothetical protein